MLLVGEKAFAEDNIAQNPECGLSRVYCEPYLRMLAMVSRDIIDEPRSMVLRQRELIGVSDAAYEHWSKEHPRFETAGQLPSSFVDFVFSKTPANSFNSILSWEQCRSARPYCLITSLKFLSQGVVVGLRQRNFSLDSDVQRRRISVVMHDKLRWESEAINVRRYGTEHTGLHGYPGTLGHGILCGGQSSMQNNERERRNADSTKRYPCEHPLWPKLPAPILPLFGAPSLFISSYCTWIATQRLGFAHLIVRALLVMASWAVILGWLVFPLSPEPVPASLVSARYAAPTLAKLSEILRLRSPVPPSPMLLRTPR